MALFSKKPKDTPRRRLQTGMPAQRATDSVLEERYAFRRNRTLTGSSSSSIASTNESAAQLKSARVQAHELAQKRRHIGAILLFVLTVCIVLFGLISQFTASVAVVSRDTTADLGPTYESVIQSYLSSRPIERLRFLVNEEQLNTYVQQKVPEVERIEVDGSAGFGKSLFTLYMREPIAGWSINGRQQYVDLTGTAFERNYFPSPQVQIVDKSGVEVQAGQAVASNRFLGFVGRTVGLAKVQGYKVLQVMIPAATTREVELHLEGVGYPIRLSIDRPAGEQTEDMARVVRWLQAQGKTPEYVDVRVSGKAFYK